MSQYGSLWREMNFLKCMSKSKGQGQKVKFFPTKKKVLSHGIYTCEKWNPYPHPLKSYRQFKVKVFEDKQTKR